MKPNELTIDLAKLFPPPGVAFETQAQRDLAVALDTLGLVKVECWNGVHAHPWKRESPYIGSLPPSKYRLAQPEPVVIGPVEAKDIWDADGWSEEDGLYTTIRKKMEKHGGKWEVTLTATAKQVQP